MKQNNAIVELDYTNYSNNPEAKYKENSDKYKAQIMRRKKQLNYELKLIFKSKEICRDLIINMVKDR